MTADEIYKQSEHLIDKRFRDPRTDKIYTYVGVLIGSDDYYYSMYSKEHGSVSLSCVGDIEGSWGFELVDKDYQTLVDRINEYIQSSGVLKPKLKDLLLDIKQHLEDNE